ncbi:MAG: magnesium-protoporphyrin IX monomethyl ester anaerobic oxidative cyclase [Verrucomicrobia bacterium]|nr:MAG: magnesium-protoporphyrin IX monomethyl ester anaerobic oxidative cyclase [Verrucomicrobiota bacterium]
MKILLINPPHPSIGSRIPREHLPPLGLLSVGGPLLDAGHELKLLDGEFGPMTMAEIVSATRHYEPDAVFLGHSGSTSGHPSATRIMRAIRSALPQTWIIYGGVFPTYHWPQIMEQEMVIDFIVRGEGEETAVRLVAALERHQPLEQVTGIVFRVGAAPGPKRLVDEDLCRDDRVVATPPAPAIRDLNACRVGWELIDHRRYTYYGKRRAVVVQFSRGCPHRCHYCGQHEFWRTWRHRDPVKFAAELARLHREHGVELINFADENPTASHSAWKAFLIALIAENVPLILIGTTRASDIVRDADILHLYKQAGVERFLLGLESTDDATLQAIHKGSTKAIDREAIRLMRKHGIISMAAWVAGFVQETDSDYWRTLRQLLSYDPDQIQALYATPHSWTPFAVQEARHRVVQTDLSRWDYKHQVLESAHVPNWRVLLWVKFIEAICQLRPKSLFRLLAHSDKRFRAGMRWYSNIGRRVWPYEVWHWLFLDHRTRHGPTLAEFLKGGWKMEPEKISRLQVAVRPERKNPMTQSCGNEIPRPWQITLESLPSTRVDERAFRAVSTKADQLIRS